MPTIFDRPKSVRGWRHGLLQVWETYCEEGSKHTNHDGEEENQKKAESGTLVAGGLGVHDCEREGSVAANDGC